MKLCGTIAAFLCVGGFALCCVGYMLEPANEILGAVGAGIGIGAIFVFITCRIIGD